MYVTRKEETESHSVRGGQNTRNSSSKEAFFLQRERDQPRKLEMPELDEIRPSP